jgi:polyhydroxyalkanoate synthesis regulator phasin
MNEAMDLAATRMQKTVRSWVSFEQRDIEDKEASLTQGKYVGRDQDFVIITPAYGKDDVHKTVDAWKEGLVLQLNMGRISQEDLNYYLAKYDAWKKGIEIPAEGSPIKGWLVLSPAQQKLLISVGILTVEDLACVNDEGVRRIGMGAVELKRKANTWLAQAQDKGPLTLKMTALQTENEGLRGEVDTLKSQVEKLIEGQKRR